MTEEETQAFQLSLLWQKLTVEYFPDMRLGPGNTLRKTGDPRKSALFKAMIRMIRRTRGLVALTDLKFWMRAQLYVCKKNDEECYVTPNMCVGPAAERRWRLYNKWIKAARERRVGNANPDEEKVSMEMVRSDLNTSLTFLKKYGEDITPQFLEKRFASGEIDKWLKFGFIRPYFVALSPTLQKLGAKVAVLSGVTNEEVISEYRAVFPKDQ